MRVLSPFPRWRHTWRAIQSALAYLIVMSKLFVADVANVVHKMCRLADISIATFLLSCLSFSLSFVLHLVYAVCNVCGE